MIALRNGISIIRIQYFKGRLFTFFLYTLHEYTTIQKSKIFVPTIPKTLPIFDSNSSVGFPYPITESIPANSVSEMYMTNRKYIEAKNLVILDPPYTTKDILNKIAIETQILTYGDETISEDAISTMKAAR
ncbi:MAG: hypothetical protein LUI06_00590 [Ruminococcus sp.]|nr:hypothetical protein [Ruminococcus sp.]